MGKLVLQFVFIVASFFVMWKLIGQVDWMTILHVEQATESLEEKLGETYWEFFKKTEEEVIDHEITSAIDKLLTKLCENNHVDRETIKLHILKSEDVNAFALPDGHIVVFSGLILDSDNEAELSGVLAHEIAHLQMGHLMKKLVKEIGLSVMISITSGNGNPEMIRQAVKLLTSSAYDRNLEREADLKAVEYLTNSSIDPQGLANFLYRMSVSAGDFPDQFYWVSTHPGGEERSKDILKHIEDSSFTSEQILTDEEWIAFQEKVQSY